MRTGPTSGRHFGGNGFKLGVLELGQLDPAEIAADRGGRGFGELACVSDEATALAELLDDLVGVGFHRRFAFGRGRKVDFAQSVFLGTARGLEPFDQLVDLVAGDIDEGRDITAQQRVPCQFTRDLALERFGRGTDRGEIFVHPAGFLAEVLRRDTGIGLVDFGLRDIQFLRDGGLDLQRFVYQIAQHLHAHASHFLVADRPLIGCQQQRHALVDIGFGDDKAVHDRCRHPAIGIAVLQHGEIARQAEQVTLGHRLLRLARDRCGSEACSCGHRKQSGNRFCSHVSNLSCGIALMPEYATRNAGARLNQS